jgi:ribosomal protein S10
LQENASSIHNTSKVKFDLPLEPIYANVPSDFTTFIKEVNKAFGNQWAPRSAFEEIYQFYLDHDPKEKRKVALMKKTMSEDHMTTYMLDAIENGGMEFIRSLGKQWKPLSQILQRMSLNQRRSFCCKILYQRMKEMRLEELAKSAIEPKQFIRETTPLTPEQRLKAEEDANWDEHLPINVRDAYLAPKKLQPPYNITVAQLQIRGYYLPPVDFMADFCLRAAYYFGLPASGPVPLPRRTERWTVLKSPFIFKKQQENFERRTFARLVTIKDGHPDIVEMWLSYCVRNMFHGTGMKVNIFTNDYVGVGKTMGEDITRLIETDRWAVEGYNELNDDAKQLQNSIDMEIKRIEGQMATRDNTERARRVLQLRVDKLLQLEGQAEREAQQGVMTDSNKYSNASEEGGMSKEAIAEKLEKRYDERKRHAMQSLVNRLPDLDVEQLEQEVEWDKQQDEALRKHLLHVGKYAQQKGIAPLTREEYFTYVPFVLLPKYKGIHEDVFEEIDTLDLLRIPRGDPGYLAGWETLTERQRYDLVLENRKRNASHYGASQSGKMDTSRLARMLARRRNRKGGSPLDIGMENLTKASAVSSTIGSSPATQIAAESVSAESADSGVGSVNGESTAAETESIQAAEENVQPNESAVSADSTTADSVDVGSEVESSEVSAAESDPQVEEAELPFDEVTSESTDEEVSSSSTDETVHHEEQEAEVSEVKDEAVETQEAESTETDVVDDAKSQGEDEPSKSEGTAEDDSTPKP